jgi:MFS family permease
VWSDKKDLYSVLNAAVVALCGFTSSILGGYLSDFFENKGFNYAKALVCIIGTGLGIPTILMCTLSQERTTKGFSIAMLGLALEYLVAESWIGCAITMVVNTISPQNRGFAVSAFLFLATISGVIATTILGKLGKVYDCPNNP